MKRYGRDTRTRWEGIYARHAVGCPVEALPRSPTLTQISRACKCDPSYWGKAYDRAESKPAKTKFLPTSSAARQARKALLDSLEKGGSPREASIRFREAHKRFIDAAKEGRTLNKKGKRYQQSAWEDIDECLRVHLTPKLGPKWLLDVRQRDLQKIIDDLTPKLSGSRVRSVINAFRSLYTWAKQHELVTHDPSAEIRLPAMNATPRDRIATPVEFALLLAALELEDALPYALGAYAWGRSSQIQRLYCEEIDLQLALLEWGVQERGARKSEAAHHVVPVVKPLLLLLKQAWLKQGRPAGKQLVCPPLRASKTGLLSTGSLATRAEKAWAKQGLQPIGLQECRHTGASWLDAAGVSPKTSSVLMSHSTPDRQPGAAPITLARYTHVMPDALETARKQMDDWLIAQLAQSSEAAHRG
jgi:integrase